MSLEGSTPSPSAIRGSANGRPAVFEAAREGSTPSPRTWRGDLWSKELLRGCLIGRTSGSEPAGVGSTPISGTETARLGRHLADHLCLNQRMLWVQLLLGPQIC